MLKKLSLGSREEPRTASFALDKVASFALDKVASFALDKVASFAYNSPFFDLKIRQTRKVTAIDMQVHGIVVNTYDIPETLQFLEENYPGVLRTQCFNEKNLPFAVEVTQTEIGHLFEHILIDNLCALKIKSGAKSAVFNGTTSWNWQENDYGSFQIWIDIGKHDLNLLIEGLKTTIKLTKSLMEFKSDTLPVDNQLSQNNLRATI